MVGHTAANDQDDDWATSVPHDLGMSHHGIGKDYSDSRIVTCFIE